MFRANADVGKINVCLLKQLIKQVNKVIALYTSVDNN